MTCKTYRVDSLDLLELVLELICLLLLELLFLDDHPVRVRVLHLSLLDRSKFVLTVDLLCGSVHHLFVVFGSDRVFRLVFCFAFHSLIIIF